MRVGSITLLLDESEPMKGDAMILTMKESQFSFTVRVLFNRRFNEDSVHCCQDI